MTDTMDDGGLRVRAVADEYYVTFVVACLVLVALGGFLVYGAYGQTNERTETTVTNEVVWTSAGQFTHQATVINDTEVFEEGQTLRNRSTYFQKIAPRLNGSFVYNYTADSGELTTETSLHLRVRSVDPEAESSREYWRIERQLDQATVTLAPNESARVSFSQNVSRIARDIERIQTQLGTSTGTTETTVLASVELNGTRNGQLVSTNRTYSLPLTIGSDLYRVNDSGPVVQQGERSVRNSQTVIVEAGPIWRYGGPLAVLAGLVGLVGLAYGRYSGQLPVTDHERAYLDYRNDRTEFDEWITEATFPAGRVEDADTSIETTSLAGLVDLAIDTDRRVIEVADDESYLVLDSDVVYYYDAPTLAAAAEPLEPGDAVSSMSDPETTAERESEQERDGGASQDADADGEAQSVFDRLRRRADLGGDGTPASDGTPVESEADETNGDENDASETNGDESDADATVTDDDSRIDADEN